MTPFPETVGDPLWYLIDVILAESSGPRRVMEWKSSRPRRVLKYRLKIGVSIYLFLSVSGMTPFPETVSDPSCSVS